MKNKKPEYVEMAVLCPDCKGEKFGINNPCATCNGQGIIKAKVSKEKADALTKKKHT